MRSSWIKWTAFFRIMAEIPDNMPITTLMIIRKVRWFIRLACQTMNLNQIALLVDLDINWANLSKFFNFVSHKQDYWIIRMTDTVKIAGKLIRAGTLLGLVLLYCITMAAGMGLSSCPAIDGENELIIYVIPSKVKYDWNSPNSLVKSYIKNIRRNIFDKKSYLLGHAFVELNTSASPEGILTGMRSARPEEAKNLVIGEYYGLAILGADISGELESREELEKKIEFYSGNGRLAFIKLIINDKAVERMLTFFEGYKAFWEQDSTTGARYGGAFWPRNKGEGAGCSAFVVSFLDLGGLLREAFDDWKVEIDIPMKLIGGPYNEGNKVRIRDIRREQKWADRQSETNNAFEHFEIYDPTLMYEWIHRLWESSDIQEKYAAVPVELNEAKGIRIDARQIQPDENEPVFYHRQTPSIFIDYYKTRFPAWYNLTLPACK